MIQKVTDKLGLIAWQSAGDQTTIVRAFSKFSPGVQQIIASADKNLKVWDLYDMEELPTWTRGHAALLGDAAHPFQPCKQPNSCKWTNLFCVTYTDNSIDLGQGAAMAIEDAVSIATLLPCGSTPDDVPTRLEMYQAGRRPRVNFVLHYTRINGRDEDDTAGDRLSGVLVLRALEWIQTDNDSCGNGESHEYLFLIQ